MIYKCSSNEIIVYIEADSEEDALLQARIIYNLDFKEAILVQD